jgi:putative ABC transport system ATP-binding protein
MLIQTKNLSKIYNPDKIPVTAIDNVSVEFQKGEFTAIVGPSGCGKTTLLNLLGGLDSPSEGEVIIENTTLNKLNESQLTDYRLKHIGFVFQSYNLIPVLTAEENVEFI